MAATMQDLLDRARRPLKDASKRRLSDTDALRYANSAIRRAYVLRPDLRFGAYTTSVTDLVASDSFPLPLEYFQAVANYVTAAGDMEEDDAAHAERGVAFMTQFERELMA